MKIKNNPKENIVYSGTTVGNLLLGLREEGRNIFFEKKPEHDLLDFYFTPNLSKAASYAFRNYSNFRSGGRAIILEGLWPKNYSLDPNQKNNDTFITREPFKIKNIWTSSARLTDPAFNVTGIHNNSRALLAEFKQKNIKDLKEILRKFN